MKLHDPGMERELLRLAKQARGGKPMEKAEKSAWRLLLPRILYTILFLSLLLCVLGAYAPGHREQHWQFAICSVVLTVAASLGISIALRPIELPGHHAALVNLPVKGDFLFRKIRSRYLLRSIPGLGAPSFIFAFAASGFSFHSPWLTIFSTLLLLATTLATVVISYQPSPAIGYARKLWFLFGLLLAGGMILFVYNGSGYFETGATPRWLADGVFMLTWLFPPTWALPGRMEHGGGLLALMWCVWGYFKWKEWPDVIGRHFDTPQDFLYLDEVEDEDDVFSEEESSFEEMDSTDSPLPVGGDGWVKRWVRRIIGRKHELIAGALLDPSVTWTKRTRLALIWSPVLLAINWVVIQIPNQSQWYETVVDCIWIASIVAVPIPLLQISNAVPRATAPWGEGPQSLPLLSLLPISSRELLQVSSRITLARSLIMAAIVTPYFWCLFSIHKTEISPAGALWLVPAFCCFWTASRPLLVWFRLQSVARCRSGMFLRDYAWVWLVIGLAIIWIVAGAVGMIFGLMWVESVNPVDDRMFFGLIAVGGILLSGLCARATFEIHHWRLRRGHFDWVSEK